MNGNGNGIAIQDLDPVFLALREAGDGIRREIQRAEGVLRDAVAELLASFKGLHGVVETQRGLLQTVTETINQDEAGKGGFAAAMNRLLGEFVDDVVRVSRDSMKMIGQLAEVSGNVGEIVLRTQDIDRLARETRFVALNARIETHKAGDAGRTFKVVADEVKRLALECADLSGQIRAEVEICESRLGATRKTAEVLASHDMTTALESRSRLGDAISRLDEVSRVLANTLARVSDDVATAMRALQFEDMLMQLLQTIRRKIEKYELLCADTLRAVAVGTALGNDGLEKVLDELRLLAASGAVAQTTMAAGSVDLF